MILNDVDYDYDLKNAIFNSINYTFKFDKKELSSDDFSQLFKNKLVLLEELIENNFFNNNFKKEEIGSMTPSLITAGNKYIRDYNSNLFKSLKNTFKRDYFEFVNLKYSTRIYNDKIRDFDLDLRSNSSNQNSIMGLYDSIIMIPELDLSVRASKNISNIDILRKEKINPTRGLELLTLK